MKFSVKCFSQSCQNGLSKEEGFLHLHNLQSCLLYLLEKLRQLLYTAKVFWKSLLKMMH